VRITTIFRQLLGVSQTRVRRVRFDGEQLIVSVAPTWRRPRCGSCGARCHGYDEATEPRRWRDLAFGECVLWLEYRLRRVDCAACGVRVERVPWAAHGSRFTLRLEELIAFLAQVADKTTAAAIAGVSWRAVSTVVKRVVDEHLDDSRFDGVTRIAIDEFSYRKRHRYITVIVDHDTGRVIWAAKGRGAKTLAAFFEQLGPERTAALTTATIDMAGGYIKALEEQAPHIEIIFDRFHVQRLAHDALDEVRREVSRAMRKDENMEQAKAIKGARFSLHRRLANQTLEDDRRLKDIRKVSKPLIRAWELKETLADILDRRQRHVAARFLGEWLGWASRSRLTPFVRAAKTIRRHLGGVVAYLKERLTNGLAEGTNNKLRAIARRAFGFHSADALIAMLYLCCGGIVLDPPLPKPTH
jgi:transposase